MKISRQELQRIIREEKARLRREDVRSASRKTKWVSGDAGKKSRANRLRRFDEQSTPPERLLNEGFKEMEMELIDDIVDMLVQRGAVPQYQEGGDEDDFYQGALDYIRDAVIPTLQDLASAGAYERK